MISAGTLRNLLVASRAFLRSKSAGGLSDIQMSDLWASVYSGQQELDAMSTATIALEPITGTEARHPDRHSRKP